VLEAKKGENADLMNLAVPMPEEPPPLDPELLAPKPERQLEPALTDVPEPEFEGPPAPESTDITPDEAVLMGPAKALQALLPVYKKTAKLPAAAHGLAEEFAKSAFEESMKAAEGDPSFKAEVPFAAAQLAVNPMAGISVAAGERGIPAIHETLESLKSPGLPLPPPVKPFSFTTQAYAAPGEPEMPVAGANESYGSFMQRMDKYDKDLAAWQGRGLPVVVKQPAPPTSVDTKMPPGLTPTATRILNTVGGPQEVSESDLTAMGILGTMSLGFALGPHIRPLLRLGRTPRLRTVPDAAPGTMDISTTGQLFRTYDDVSKGLVNLSIRAGASPQDVALIESSHRLQGRAQAHALAQSAVGAEAEFRTPTYQFKAPTALPKLEALRTAETDRYLILRSTQDDLNVLSQKPEYTASKTNPNPGPPTIDGMTLKDVHREMFALEKAHPEVVTYSKQYNAFLDEVRKFEAAGEYRTIPLKRTPKHQLEPGVEDPSLEYLRDQRPNEVPSRGRRDLGELTGREGPISALTAYTKKVIAEKLNNEVVGLTLDTIRKSNPALAVEITAAEKAANPRWDSRTTTFRRDGKAVHYTTGGFLNDVLRMDPLTFSGPWANALYATKNMLEFGSTRAGAPAFAVVNLARSHQIAKFTVENGRRSAGIIRSLYAIPQQLLPQMARAFATGLDHGSGQWLQRVFPKAHLDALSKRLAYEADRSLYYQLKAYGSHGGGFYMDPAKVSQTSMTKLQNFMDTKWKTLTRPEQLFWTAWKQTLEAVHGANAHAFVAKNLKPPSLVPRMAMAAVGNKFKQGTMQELALEQRRLTGDPRTKGEYYVRARAGDVGYRPGDLRPIRLDSDNIITQGAVKLLRAYGAPMAFLAEGSPWFNATVQGAKRIGEAYLKNPIRFTTRMWMYAMAPAAAEYLYAFQLGKDPNGVSYIDHLLNRRSAYNKQMNWYIPIWGRPAEEGIEFPSFHEIAPFRRLMTIAMDHALRTDRHKMERTLAQDYWNAMWATMETAVIPPMPPIMNVGLSIAGVQPMQGIWGGDAYKAKEDPFSQTGGMASSIENIARSLSGGIGHTMGQMYAAYSQTPEGFNEALWNAAKAGGRVQVQKTPILRDILQMQPTVTGNTDITKELFDKQKEVDRLTKYIEKWDLGGKYQGPGEINVHPPSKGGGDVVNWLSGPGFSEQSTGLAQPPPTNPLYKHFMEQVRNNFRKESPLPNTKTGEDEGGIAFKSMWARYGDATEKLRRLKDVNEGNYVTWQQRLEKFPEAKKELTDAGVDPTNIRQARNYYERKRHDSARVILYTIRAVEHDITNQLKANPQLAAKLGWDGKPLTLAKLDPYGRGITQQSLAGDAADFIFPDLVNQFSGQ